MSFLKNTVVGWGAMLVLSLTTGMASSEVSLLSSAATGEIERLVHAEMEQRHIPGLAVTIVRDGRTLWTGCIGLADVENNVPVNEQTVFRFASVSKAITAVVALRLVEEGKLKLESRVATFLDPGSGVPDGPITVRHLLAHQSGLRHYQPRASREPLTHYNQLADALRAKVDDPLLFEPGTKFSYTTHGYLAIGRVIEVVGGKTFAECMHASVFSIAGMKTAHVDDLYTLIPHRAQGYFRSFTGELRNSEPADLSDKVPGGGLCGTIGDFGAFAIALQGHTLLSPETTTLMWTQQNLTSGSATSYGLGWYVDRFEGRREVYHPGTQARVSTLLWLSPDDGVAVAILCNLEQVNFISLARKLGKVAREIPITAERREYFDTQPSS